MDKKKFMFFNVIGAFAWSFSLIFAGHYLYKFFLDNYQIDLKHYIEYIVIGIVLVTTLPVILKFIKKKVHLEE